MKKPTTATRRKTSYAGYLQLNRILSSQKPESSPEAHDELLFIVVHQCFELGFKLMLHEIETLMARLSAGETLSSVRTFRRLNEILRTFDGHLTVLETMSPADFAQFREHLRPASGFQSWQFRELEFVCGLRDERFLKMFDDDPPHRKILESRLDGPTVWEAFCLLLKRYGYEVLGAEEQRGAVARIYGEGRHEDLRILCEAMVEFDERFGLWRRHHALMAERMIGGKPGTGQPLVDKAFGKRGPMGSMGVEYLTGTLDKRFFPLLWEARNSL